MKFFGAFFDRHLDEALAALSKLHIIDNEHSTASTAQVIMLDTSFKEHFRQTLTGGCVCCQAKVLHGS